MSLLEGKNWGWTPDSLICDVIIENRCVNGQVTYRARKDGELLFNGKEDFDHTGVINALRTAGHIP